MKILMISPNLIYPPTDGGRIRMYYLFKHLSINNDVTLLSFNYSEDNLKNIEKLKKYCEAVEIVQLEYSSQKDWLTKLRNSFLNKFFGYPRIALYHYSKKMKRRIKQLINKNNYDVVLIEYWFMGQYAKFCDKRKFFFKNKKIIKILDELDIEHMREKRIAEIEKNSKKKIWFYFNHFGWKKTKEYELRFIKKFDRIITVSSKDKEILKKEIPNLDVVVIPICIYLDYIKPSKKYEKMDHLNNLVFVGSYYHHPNVDAILYFCRDIFPKILKQIPKTHLYIVGSNTTKEIFDLASENITVTGPVKDVRPYIYKGISIVPLRAGSGTRVKIIEAMGLGSPVITTSIGAEGLDVIPGKHLLIADNAEKFAEQTINLLRNRSLRNRLRKNSLELVQKKYSWNKKMCKLLEESVNYHNLNHRF